VQLNKEDNKLLLTVEDDGKGFDIASLQEAKVRTDGSVGRGIGWTNIKSRLDYLKGKLDVQSEPGKGTSVNIEISL
jgi:signal transduction histidine kinase